MLSSWVCQETIAVVVFENWDRAEIRLTRKSSKSRNTFSANCAGRQSSMPNRVQRVWTKPVQCWIHRNTTSLINICAGDIRRCLFPKQLGLPGEGSFVDASNVCFCPTPQFRDGLHWWGNRSRETTLSVIPSGQGGVNHQQKQTFNEPSAVYWEHSRMKKKLIEVIFGINPNIAKNEKVEVVIDTESKLTDNG